MSRTTEALPQGHTPGPWTVEDPLGPEILSVVANSSGPVYEWRHIAQLSAEVPEDRFDPSVSEQQANARLIAAAPDLLAALREVLRCAALPDSWAAPVRAAIAKATAHDVVRPAVGSERTP